MKLLFSSIVSSILEIIIFSIIPFIWWLVTARKKESFFKWLGLKKIEKENKKSVIISVSTIALLFIILSIFTLYMVKDIEMATSKFQGLGFSALLPALVYAIFQTSLAEEILFRGFLLKRISNKWNFTVGNSIQSILFGLLHGVLFFNLVGSIKALLIILFTGMIAYSIGYINEKKANASILPSWIIHATANIFSSY